MCDWIDKLWEKRGLFITPIAINRDIEYRSGLRDIFQILEDSLVEVAAENFYVEEVQKYKESLLYSIDQYYSGYIDEAQKQIETLINEFDDNTLAISNINNSISFCTYEFPQNVQFFRARCNEKIVDYKRKDMLHIPFSKRSIIKSERFSIPGFPCLYLGTTSYVCWIELGRPADYMFNVAPVTLDNTQRIFNLAINFTDFISARSNHNPEIETIFRLFLLSIATSFKVKEDNRGFKSEYVISQLIMLACMKRGLAGLAYYVYVK